MKIVIIGGGVIGLSCAYFLSKEGHDITIIERSDGTDNCSFGNAGYISPSHFIPLASPGIVAQGLKWMLSNTSPFYIKPRLDVSLIRWGLKFYSKSNAKTVAKNAPHLNDILQLSRKLMIDMDREFDHSFRLEQNGCLMLYKSEKTGNHEIELANEAKRFGIKTQILSSLQVQQMEPEVSVDVLGGVYFPIDCHLHPVHMMNSLYSKIQKAGVKILFSHEVNDFEIQSDQVNAVITNKDKINCDQLIVAAGSWLEIVSKKLGIQLLLQPGKGYSTTYDERLKNLRHPAILVDDRVAVTPLGAGLRIGGTMELSGINSKIQMNRVTPIVHAVNTYFPDLHLEVPPIEKIWSGLRPCSPDGLPYIGRSPHHNNVIIAGGHAMLGISLAAATGLLVRQLIQNQKTEISIEPFRIYR